MELTPMQAAYWVGRETSGRCSGVSSHLFIEFDGEGIEPEPLEHALRKLVQTHPMLRLRITPLGQQVIQPLADRHRLRTEDLSAQTPKQIAARLTEIRTEMSHQRLPLEAGTCFDLRLSLLPQGRHRLHLDLDMIAVDPSCLSLLLEDLAQFYETPGAPLSRPAPDACFFDYLNRRAALPDHSEAARDWWQKRLETLPEAPALPWREGADHSAPRSIRLAATLPETVAQRLNALARQHRVTPSTLCLAVFSAVLGRATGQEQFRLSVPTFLRQPVLRGVEHLVGDFSDLTLLGIELSPESALSDLLAQLQQKMSALLSNLSYSGVSVLRDLSRLSGKVEGAPVVFTSGLDLPQGALIGPHASRVFGEMVWTISQAPHVALDVQLARLAEGILVNWDIRIDALPEPWVRQIFSIFISALTKITAEPEVIDQPLSDWLTPPPLPRQLDPLLRSYLLGRQADMPLGGVAMQDFRHYRGRIDPTELRIRLAEEIRLHPALRSQIDLDDLTVTIAETVEANLAEIDLTALPKAEAEAQLAQLARRFATRHSDLARPPWQLDLIHLPDQEQALFVRCDALIFDAAAISQLMQRLLSPQKPGPFLAPEPPADSHDAPFRRPEDEAYWTAKLAEVEDPPLLPWAMALEDIRLADWHRAWITIPKARLANLSRMGAKRGLFRNSLLMAVLLEVLARWTPDLTLPVGVPLGLPTPGPLANRSSFIAVNYDARQGDFATRAALLQADIQTGIQHIAFSGVDLSRALMGRNGGRIALPVVITNGLGWDRLPPETPLQEVDGLTPTPQVAMDFRLTLDGAGNLVLALDHVRQAVSESLALTLLHAVASAFEALERKADLTLTGADYLPYQSGSAVIGQEFSGTGFLSSIGRNLWPEQLGGKDLPLRNRSPLAVIAGETRLSYPDLAKLIAELRGGLSELGLTTGHVVAICLPRGPEHLALSLACALSELTWVPIDAASPPERLGYLLQQCHADLVVTAAPAILPDAVSFGQLRAAPLAPPDAQTLAALDRHDTIGYYLYTSGTTGQPKCVVLSNRATANTIGHTLDRWRITPADRVISITPLHHDMSVFDLFGTMAAGATLVMPRPEDSKDALAWNSLIHREAVTIWTSVPAMVEMLLACQDGDSLASLRLVAQGGDYIKPAIIDRLRGLLPWAELWSLGGPTETTIWSIRHKITAFDREKIPYGQALPGNQYLILNALNEPCPPQVAGRIHTAGINLARGYLVSGALSQTDFVSLPASHLGPSCAEVPQVQTTELRAFRTGDIGAFREDGVLLFGTRVNGYVKVRGVRISLEDVAGQLSRHPGLAQVLVVDLCDPASGDTSLAALYCPVSGTVEGAVSGTVSVADLRAFAAQRLPGSHVPTRFIALPALPLSANGKPDRKKARALAQEIAQAEHHKPVETDPVLAACLRVIGAAESPPVTLDTPLLSLGLLPSHLKALAGALTQETGVSLRLPALLQCRTTRQISALIAAGQTALNETLVAQ